MAVVNDIYALGSMKKRGRPCWVFVKAVAPTQDQTLDTYDEYLGVNLIEPVEVMSLPIHASMNS